MAGATEPGVTPEALPATTASGEARLAQPAAADPARAGATNAAATEHDAQPVDPQAPAAAPSASGSAPEPRPGASPAVPAGSAAAALQQPVPVPKLTLVERLKKGEEFWAWKVGTRSLAWVAKVIGIGCATWVAVDAIGIAFSNGYVYFLADKTIALFTIGFFAIALLWDSLELLFRFLRRSCRPVHPGVVVGVDLILWLSLSLLFPASLLALYGVQSFTPEGYSFGSSASGSRIQGRYYLDTGSDTWIFNVTRVYDDYSTRKWNSTSGEWYYPTPKTYTPDELASLRDCGDNFSSCAELDALVNVLWHQKPQRMAADTAATAMLCLAAVCHFVLFVWACVSVHQRRRSKTVISMAQEVVQGMVDRGELIVTTRPQPVHLTPAPGAKEGQAVNTGYWHPQYNPYGPVVSTMPVAPVAPPPRTVRYG